MPAIARTQTNTLIHSHRLNATLWASIHWGALTIGTLAFFNRLNLPFIENKHNSIVAIFGMSTAYISIAFNQYYRDMENELLNIKEK